MEIEILHLLEGAKKAKGVTVIIDVFRAFSLETIILAKGASKIFPVGSVEEALSLKEDYPDALLVGERDGKKIEGFDYGNSPSQIAKVDLHNKTIIHTTSAGTQGIVLAEEAELIMTGALVNAKATAEYIKRINPTHVSLVAMGWKGQKDTKEDLLCAEYIKSILEYKPITNIHQLAYDLRNDAGKHFFDPSNQDVFPKEDFEYCIEVDKYDFPILIGVYNNRWVCSKEKD